MRTRIDSKGRYHCANCGQLLQEIGDVLPVHICPVLDNRNDPETLK